VPRLSPVELEIWLAEQGWPWGIDGLVRAADYDPELAPFMERLKSKKAKRRKAVEWYCDQRHRIPNAPESVYDTRGIVSIGSEPTREPHYVDGEPVDRAPDLDPKHVVDDDPAPDYWGRLPRLDEAAGSSGPERGAPELGIPDRELWWIIERRLEKGERASRKWLARETKRRSDLDYVPRDRLTPLVDWIDEHPEGARRALSLRIIPSEFRAGKLGPVPPGA
jgi:hypothetical protein